MKRFLYLILLLGCWGQSEGENCTTFNLFKSDGGGYYCIPNRMGKDTLLIDYQNYKGKNDSIILEKILYLKKRGNKVMMIANLMGAKSSMILYVRRTNDSYQPLYVEENPSIYSFREINLKGHRFYLLYFRYSGICAEKDGISIYTNDGMNLYKSFDATTKLEFYYGKNPSSPCKTGISYIQKFSLKIQKGKIVLITNKKTEDKRHISRTYQFQNHYFK